MKSFLRIVLMLIFSHANATLAGQSDRSVYPQPPDDPGAYYLSPDAIGVHADGAHDDTTALQGAIARVGSAPGASAVRAAWYLTPKQHMYVWPVVRLIVFGADRPVFTLGADSPGFQEGDDRYLLFFSGGRGTEPGAPPRDGTPGTFTAR